MLFFVLKDSVFVKLCICWRCRSSRREVFLRTGVLKICSKFTGEHPCRSAISIKLLCSFIEITLRHGCSSVNLLQIFKILCPKNTSGGLLLMALFRLKSSFRSRDIQIFVFPSSPLFLNVGHCFRRWSKINIKVYDVAIV